MEHSVITHYYTFLPSLIALGTDELQSGGIAKERFTLGPYTSVILDTVFAKNMPNNDVIFTFDFSSLYVISAERRPSESDVIGAFLWEE